MNNYAESKKQLDAIRDKYGCKGEVIFRAAIQYVIEFGQRNFKDKVWFDELVNDVDERHNLAEANGEILFVTRDFEKAILECAKELAQIEPYDFLIYIQREIYLGGDGISYQRIIKLLHKCMDWIDETHMTGADCYDTLQYLDFTDNEIEELGYGYLLDLKMEDDE